MQKIVMILAIAGMLLNAMGNELFDKYLDKIYPIKCTIVKMNKKWIARWGDNLMISAVVGESDENLKTYSHLKIFWNGNVIGNFHDNEYELPKNKFPKIRNLKNGDLEMLLNLNDRPLPNIIVRIVIRKDKIVQMDSLPFENVLHINKNNGTEGLFSGFLEDVELPCVNCDSVYYNPILYHKITDDGILLDSATTINENQKYFGKFHGFKPDETTIIKIIKK